MTREPFRGLLKEGFTCSKSKHGNNAERVGCSHRERVRRAVYYNYDAVSVGHGRIHRLIYGE